MKLVLDMLSQWGMMLWVNQMLGLLVQQLIIYVDKKIFKKTWFFPKVYYIYTKHEDFQ